MTSVYRNLARDFRTLIVALTTITVTALGAVSLFMLVQLNRANDDDTVRELRGVASVAAAEAARASDDGVLRPDTLQMMVDEVGRAMAARVTILDKGGRIVADTAASARGESAASQPEFVEAVRRGAGATARHANGIPTLFAATAIQLGGDRIGYARAGRARSAIYGALPPELFEYLGVAGIVILVVGAFMSRRVEHRATRLIGDLDRSIAVARESEERFQLAARATSDALWDWDMPRRVLWWSEGFRTLFGHDPAGASVEMWESLAHPDDRDRVLRGLRAFVQSPGESWSDEYRLRRHDGSYAWVLDRAYAIRNDRGEAGRLIGSTLDITERKEAERMKSDFVSFVSHQLRTPLAGMNWMLELAAETDGLPDEVRSNIHDARESAARLVSLVNDLLDIARLESGRVASSPAPVALPPLTDAVADEMQTLVADKQHELRVDADGPLPPVYGDPQLLRQVVLNLLSNAIKYTPPGGRIGVRMTRQNGSVTWAVRDTGVGVPRLAQARLFEKFYRADNVMTLEAEGTGLGLHLVKLIVEQAGGRVWCESEEGQGATFAFTLPAFTEEQGDAR